MSGAPQRAETILFDKLACNGRLKRANADRSLVRAHAEAMDEALRESVATKTDLRAETIRLENKIELALAIRDLTVRTGAVAIALASIKSFA
jgi:hypothetical protein